MLATDEQAFGVIFLQLRGVLAPFKADRAEIRQVIPAYFTVLRPWPLQAVRAGADHCAARLTRFPRPAEWIDAIPKARAAGLLPITDEQRAEYYDARDRGYDGDPCACYQCQQAGVSHRLLRYVPDYDEYDRDVRRADGDKIITLGHWAHGDELARWYAARDRFFALAAIYGPKSMPSAR